MDRQEWSNLESLLTKASEVPSGVLMAHERESLQRAKKVAYEMSHLPLSAVVV
jgi:hypothetical protein